MHAHHHLYVVVSNEVCPGGNNWLYTEYTYIMPHFGSEYVNKLLIDDFCDQ